MACTAGPVLSVKETVPVLGRYHAPLLAAGT
jgi:hypothetical protein